MPRPISPMERIPTTGFGRVEEAAICVKGLRFLSERGEGGLPEVMKAGRNRPGDAERAGDMVSWVCHLTEVCGGRRSNGVPVPRQLNFRWGPKIYIS